MNMLESDWNGNEALLSAANSLSRNVNDTELVMTSRIWFVGSLVVLGLTALWDNISVNIGPSPKERD